MTIERRRKMEEKKYNNNGLFKGFLIGGLLGMTAGILFAPKSGKDLRSDIRGKGEKILKDTKQFYSDSRVKAESIYEDVRSRIFTGGRKAGVEPSRNFESPEEILSEA
jgi:gas vesicle protein